MPTRVRKRGKGKYVVEHKKDGWKTASRHTSKKKAKSSQRAREGGSRGWKPTRKRKCSKGKKRK